MLERFPGGLLVVVRPLIRERIHQKDALGPALGDVLVLQLLGEGQVVALVEVPRGLVGHLLPRRRRHQTHAAAGDLSETDVEAADAPRVDEDYRVGHGPMLLLRLVVFPPNVQDGLRIEGQGEAAAEFTVQVRVAHRGGRPDEGVENPPGPRVNAGGRRLDLQGQALDVDLAVAAHEVVRRLGGDRSVARMVRDDVQDRFLRIRQSVGRREAGVGDARKSGDHFCRSQFAYGRRPRFLRREGQGDVQRRVVQELEPLQQMGRVIPCIVPHIPIVIVPLGRRRH
mmetsp:Transcript_7025/g.22947  ORF Transcript_7025/g.22947 Transcript_7025/m.22947 type:complete len:283 (-) Transcript_7025:955-1803(-)